MTTLAWTLVHFLWQGALVGLIASPILRARSLSPAARYWTGVIALAAMLASTLVTFAVLARSSPHASAAATTAAGQTSALTASAMAPLEAAVLPLTAPSASLSTRATGSPADRYLPYVFILWAIGVVMLSTRLAVRWWLARRLAHGARVLSVRDINALAQQVAGRLALDRVVRLLESTDVAVPVVVGWLRPVIILPAAAMAGMPPAHLEALLAHELAHVQRHDYLVNLLQSMVETLLFYHPAVWWVSREVRIAREHCCDDLAVAVCDRLEYVTALTRLAAMTTHPRIALAASDGSLVSRVRRLIGSDADTVPASSGWAVAAAAVMLMGAVPATMAIGRTDRQAPATTMATSSGSATVAQTAPAPASATAVAAPVATTRPITATSARAIGAPVTAAQAGSSGGDGATAATPQVVGTAEQSASSEAERLRQQLVVFEREMEALRKLQVELQRQRALRTSDDAIESQKADLERETASLAEARRKYEVGAVSVEVVRDMEAELAKLQKEIAATERERQFKAQDFDLQEQAALKEREYQRVKEAYASSLDREAPVSRKLAGQSQGPQPQEVVITVNGQTPQRMAPSPQPYVSGQPAVVTHFAQATADARTTDGRIISEFKFLAWREGAGVRVMVLAFVPRTGEKNEFTNDPKLGEFVDFATYLLSVGGTQTVPGTRGSGGIVVAVK